MRYHLTTAANPSRPHDQDPRWPSCPPCRQIFLLLTSSLLATTLEAQQFERAPDLPSAATYSFGCAWGDYDNDGFIDLAVANGGERGNQPLDIYRNQGDGNFATTTTAEVGLAVGEAREWVCVSWADVNNDGHADLLASAGWNHMAYDRLYLNNGAGAFTAPPAGDLTRLIHYYTGGIIPVDYDLDGRLDLFTGCAYRPVGMYNRLYQGAGDGTFTLLASHAISTDSFDANSAAWADYDNDGDPDLFIANFTGRPD